MRVRVRLLSIFQARFPAFAEFKDLELPERSLVRDILTKIGIPQEMGFTILVNQARADLDRELKQGDRVEILPLLSGG